MRNTIGATTLSLGYAVIFGNIVLLPLWLQTQQGYTATWAGFATAPVGLLPIVIAPFLGRYMSRLDMRWWVTASLVSFGVMLLWFSGLETGVSFGEVAWGRFLQGVGLAFFFPPLLAITIAGLPQQRVAAATGLANTVRTLAGSFATSLTTTAWDRREAHHQSQLAEHITDFDAITRATTERLNDLGAHGGSAWALIDRTISQQAYMLATNELFWVWGWAFIALVALVWMARPPFAAAAHAVAD